MQIYRVALLKMWERVCMYRCAIEHWKQNKLKSLTSVNFSYKNAWIKQPGNKLYYDFIWYSCLYTGRLLNLTGLKWRLLEWSEANGIWKSWCYNLLAEWRRKLSSGTEHVCGTPNAAILQLPCNLPPRISRGIVTPRLRKWCGAASSKQRLTVWQHNATDIGCAIYRARLQTVWTRWTPKSFSTSLVGEIDKYKRSLL